MKIIGITGTIGAGKGTIVQYLIENKSFVHYSVRTYLSSIILKRGMKVNRDSMVLVANELRSQHSPSYIIEQLYENAISDGRNCIIESIRTPGEVIALREKGNFWLFAVDAEPKIRFERIKQRNSETDQIDYQTFLSNEAREMNSNDPNKQNLFKCIQMADYVLNNNESVGKLYAEIENILGKIELLTN